MTRFAWRSCVGSPVVVYSIIPIVAASMPAPRSSSCSDDHGMTCSMSRKGDCWDNAVVESFNATIKTELIYRTKWQTREEARAAIYNWIESWYNRKRLHSTLGYRSPDDFERRTKNGQLLKTQTAV